jgi:hypothetical protein
MNVVLGINTCFAVKRWPRVADWGPIVRDRLGLRVIQHSLDLVVAQADDARAFRSELAGLGLELHSTFTGLAAYSANLLLHPEPRGRRAAEDWYGWAIRWTAEAGGHATGGHVGAFSVREWQDATARDARWRELRAALARLTAEAGAAGLDYLVIENLAAAREPSTMAMIRDLVNEGGPGRVPIRLCLDVGHMCVPGTAGDERDPYAWLRTMAPLASMIQLQQSDADGDHHWPFTATRNALGRIDADRVLDGLDAGGMATIPLFLEVIPAFEQPDDEVLDEVEASVDYWRAAFERRGLA